MAARILAIGELLIEFVALGAGGEHERLGGYEGPFPSGAPAICLDQAARMGACAVMVGAVGPDGFGRAILARLRESGVDARAVRPSARPTGVAFVAYGGDGSRTFVFHLAGTAAADVRLPEPAPWGPRSILHVSGSSLGSPAIRRAVLDGAAYVLDAGGSLSLDPNVRPELMREGAAVEALGWLARRARYLMPSLEDLPALHPGLSPEAAVAAMRAGGAEVVALERGAGGALVVRGEERVDLPGHRVEVVDPTGAGDCFCGTLLALLAQGAGLEAAARWANAAAASSVTRRGPMEGNGGRAAGAGFLAAHGEPVPEAPR